MCDIVKVGRAAHSVHPRTPVELLEQRAASRLLSGGYTFLKGGEIETGSLAFCQLGERAQAIATVLRS
jgi:hypothetical protein